MRNRVQLHTMKQHRMAVLGLPIVLIGIVLAIALALAPTPGGENGIPRAEADGGDFMLDFIAAAPDDYDHTTSPAQELSSGGLQFDARAINDHVVEQLEAEDFACDDTIVFFTEITVDGGATGSQTASLNYDFDAHNNGQQGVGYSDVVAVGLSAEGVFAAGQANETGHSKSGNESATLASGPTFFPGSDAVWSPGTHDSMLFTVDISGLEAGETVIVRIDVRFSCYALPLTGNLHAAIDSAEVTAAGSGTINVGRQDIPMLGLGDLPTPTTTPTNTPTNTPTHTPTHTPTNTPTHTPTHTPTNTPTHTPTHTPTITPTGTLTPTVTSTNTPTHTPTNTPTNTPEPTETPTPTRTSEVLPTVVGPTPTKPPIDLKGDVNCDGKINSRDALMVLQLNAGLKNILPCIQNADVNWDRRINSKDAALILQYHVGLLDHLPA